MVKLAAHFADTAVLVKACLHCLDNLKAQDIVCIDVSAHSSVAEVMIICTGTSNRHVCAIADRMVEALAKAGLHGATVSGEQEGKWVLVDLGSVMVHVMQQESRERYQLEKLYECIAAGLEE